MTNAPSTSWFIVDVLKHNDIYTVQVAYSFTSAICPVYIRTQTNGTWNAWRLFNPGTANTAQVLTGYTFSSANGTNLSGTMPNRGNLNWSGSNTTYSVPAGYYSGGTLDSRTSYNNGYNSGVAAYRMTYANLRFSGKSKEFATVGTYTATRTGQHLFVFNKSCQAQPNDMDGQALLNGAVISSFEGASYSGSSSGNTYSWKFAVSLTSGNVVTFQLRNHYSKSYTTIIDGAVAF